MAAALSVIVAKDGAAATVVGGLQYLDLSGAGTGPWAQTNVIVDGIAGLQRAAVVAVNTAPVTATHPALVSVLRPDSAGIITTGTAGSASSQVLSIQGIASMTPVGVSAASGAFASGSIASGALASGSIAAGAVAAGATSFVKLEDVASADADAGVPAMAIRKATPANTSGTDGDYEMLQVANGRLWTNLSGFASIATWTEGTAAYAASDLLGPGAGNAAITFANAALGAGEYMVTSVSLMINRAALISGETSYVLYLYNVTPPSNIATSALFQLTATDQAAFLDAIPIPTLTVTGTSTNATLFAKIDGVNKQITTASSSIFGYLMSVGAYTPTAVAATVTIHTVAI